MRETASCSACKQTLLDSCASALEDLAAALCSSSALRRKTCSFCRTAHCLRSLATSSISSLLKEKKPLNLTVLFGHVFFDSLWRPLFLQGQEVGECRRPGTATGKRSFLRRLSWRMARKFPLSWTVNFRRTGHPAHTFFGGICAGRSHLCCLPWHRASPPTSHGSL